MHDCQRFRENWAAGLAEDVEACDQCQSFTEDVQFILQAVEAKRVQMPPDAYWHRYEERLRKKLHDDSRTSFYWRWSAVTAATAAAATIAVLLGWYGAPAAPQELSNSSATQIEFVDEHIQGLNPTVVSYLAQSELFLRTFTKIDPTYTEDLQDAQARAREVLGEIQTQKMRAADFAPVRIALDEYETVLRDIKNLESPDDVAAIQGIIRSSGLIASMRAYQPQIMLVSGP